MTDRSFRGKPSKTHIIWTRKTRDGKTKKRFDNKHFEKWANHCGFDFEKGTRVDHDRGNEPRAQFRCIFKWGTIDSETIELGEEEWSLGQQKTPRTFIEIDEQGMARVKGWTFERTMEIVSMRHKGPELLIETDEQKQWRLNARKFVSDPREQQEERT